MRAPAVDDTYLAAVLHDTGQRQLHPPSLESRRALYAARCADDDLFACALRDAKELPLRSWKAVHPGVLTKGCSEGRLVQCLAGARLMLETAAKAAPEAARKSHESARSMSQYACDAGLQAGCYELARALLASPAGPSDASEAARLADVACEARFAPGCLLAATLKDRAQAVEAFGLASRSCEWGLVAGCESVAHAHENGLGTVRDLGASLALWNDACEAGSTTACIRAGVLTSTEGLPTYAPEKAAERFRTACEAGERAACVLGAVLVEEGRGVARDVSAALAVYRDQCEADESTGCDRLGRAYFEGVSAARDPRKAAELYRKSCDLKPAQGCEAFAALLASGEGVTKDLAGARKISTRACEAGHFPSCRWLGADAAAAGDARKAAVSYATGCDGDDALSCLALGHLLRDGAPNLPVDAANAFQRLARACELGTYPGCHDVAALHRAGTGTAKNAARWLELEKSACEHGVGEACHALGEAHASGADVAADADASRDFHRKACILAHKPSCQALGFENARAFLVPACLEGNDASCVLAADDFAGQWALPPEAALTQPPIDDATALAVYRGACRKDPKSDHCLMIPSLAHDDREADALVIAACDAGRSDLCLAAAAALLPTEAAKAARLFDTACESAKKGCGTLASLAMTGTGVSKDRARAIALAHKGCDADDALACRVELDLLPPGEHPSRPDLEKKLCGGAAADTVPYRAKTPLGFPVLDDDRPFLRVSGADKHIQAYRWDDLTADCFAAARERWTRTPALALELLAKYAGNAARYGASRKARTDAGEEMHARLADACEHGLAPACVVLSDRDPALPAESARPEWHCVGTRVDATDDGCGDWVAPRTDVLEKACAAGVGDACYGRAVLDLADVTDAVRGPAIRTWFEKGCDAPDENRSLRACVHVAAYLDPAAAQSLFDAARTSGLVFQPPAHIDSAVAAPLGDVEENGGE